MTQPIVSILVPVYGVEKYIKRCAVSLMEQTYEDIEYIFVDDASPDQSIAVLEEVVARYAKRKLHVRVLHHEQNRGLSAARNTAVAAATGKYLLHVDSDDYLATDAVDKLVCVAEANQADIVLFDTVELRESGEVCLQAEYQERVAYIKGLLQHTNRCAHWNKFYRAAFYKGTGIQSVETVRLAEDYAVTPRIVHQAKQISVLHEPLYYYETRNQSSYVHNLNRAAIESQHLADQVLVDYFRNVPDKTIWADVIDILPQRTIVSLVKRSGRESWEMIREIYSEELQHSGRGLKWLDRIIYSLFAQHRYGMLTLLVRIYRCIFALLK